MAATCKYCGVGPLQKFGTQVKCVSCGSVYSAAGVFGNSKPNSHLSSAADDIRNINQNYKNESARMRQEAKEEFKRRDREREAKIAAAKAQKAAKANAKSGDTKKAQKSILARVGAGLAIGFLASLINPSLFVIGFIIGFII